MPGQDAPVWRSRGYLPHFDGGRQQTITFRLHDSLPAEVMARLERELPPSSSGAAVSERNRRIQALLDSGAGSCLLARPDVAAAMEGALLFGDGERYRLLAWVVMPNHVHVVAEPLPGWGLDRIVQGWKSVVAHHVEAADPEAPMWQREYWDRYIRDEEHFRRCVEYIHMNPVKARLVSRPGGWRWSSAWSGRRGQGRGSSSANKDA